MFSGSVQHFNKREANEEKKLVNVSQLYISKECFHLKSEKIVLILKLLKSTKHKLIYHSNFLKNPILPDFCFDEKEKSLINYLYRSI